MMNRRGIRTCVTALERREFSLDCGRGKRNFALTDFDPRAQGDSMQMMRQPAGAGYDRRQWRNPLDIRRARVIRPGREIPVRHPARASLLPEVVRHARIIPEHRSPASPAAERHRLRVIVLANPQAAGRSTGAWTGRSAASTNVKIGTLAACAPARIITPAAIGVLARSGARRRRTRLPAAT